MVHLARRAREARDTPELDFIAVNESHALAPYRQAALWYPGKGITALSGVVSPEANAPYVQWLEGLCRHVARTYPRPEPRALEAADLPAEGIE